MAKKVVQHHFGKSLQKIEFKPAGKTNYVFEVITKERDYIVRISAEKNKLQDFTKEQWATHKARGIGVPVPEILEVGNEIIEMPYMLQEKVNGKEAVDHPQRLQILFELGKYSKLIHSIPTTGYGKVFDWSKNKLSKNNSWIEFLDKEYEVSKAISFFEKHNILSKGKLKKLVSMFSKIRKWKHQPTLNHGDLRLKNVIANKQGHLKAIIDWEHCNSNVAPYWDFAIALHDLSIDGKQHFLDGYGLDAVEFNNMSYAMTAFNLVNYIPALNKLIEEKNENILQLYKLRLNGAMDLFSL